MMKGRFSVKHQGFRLLTILLSLLLLILAVSCGTSAEHQGTEDQAGPAPVTQATTAEDHVHETTAPTVNYAPDFEVMDKDGNTVKLSDFRGKPVVLNFWATWCPPCKAELPDFDEAATAYGEEVTFLMVNLTDGSRDTVSLVKEFVSDNGYTFPVYFDTQYSAANAYRVSSIPTTYLINAEGEIIGSKVGMMTASELEIWIQKLLK